MKTLHRSILLGLAALIAGCQTTSTMQTKPSARPSVKLGVEVLFEKHPELVRGKHVGLITNPTGLDSKLDSIVEIFRAHPEVKLTALYGPEHGVRGNAQAGEYVAFYYDEHFKLPVFSLYGQTHKPPADIDKVMGTSTVREALERGEPVEKIVASTQPGLKEFAKLREPYLLYR